MAEIFVEDRTSTALRMEDSRVEDVVSGKDVGAGIRIMSGDSASYAFTNLLSEDALLDAARAARAGLREGTPSAPMDLRTVEPSVVHAVERRPETVGAGDKVEALKIADESARSVSGDVRQVVVSYADVRQKVLIASSDGQRTEDDRTAFGS